MTRKSCIGITQTVSIVIFSCSSLLAVGLNFLMYQDSDSVSSFDQINLKNLSDWQILLFNKYETLSMVSLAVSTAVFLGSVYLWVRLLIANSSGITLDMQALSAESSNIQNQQQYNPESLSSKRSSESKEEKCQSKRSKSSTTKSSKTEKHVRSVSVEKLPASMETQTTCLSIFVFSFVFVLCLGMLILGVGSWITFSTVKKAAQSPSQQLQELTTELFVCGILTAINCALSLFWMVLVFCAKSIWRYRISDGNTMQRTLIYRKKSKQVQPQKKPSEDFDKNMHFGGVIEDSLSFDFPQDNLRSMQILVERQNHSHHESGSNHEIDEFSEIPSSQEQNVFQQEAAMSQKVSENLNMRVCQGRQSNVTEFSLLDPYIDKYYSRVAGSQIGKEELKKLIYEMIRNQIKGHLTRFNLLTISNQFKGEDESQVKEDRRFSCENTQKMDDLMAKNNVAKQKVTEQCQNQDPNIPFEALNDAQLMEEQTIIDELVEVVNSMCIQPVLHRESSTEQISKIQAPLQVVKEKLNHKQGPQKKRKTRLFDERSVMLRLHKKIGTKISKRIFE